MKYYSGIYLDDKSKVYQVSNDVDGLSCEILADPGVCISKDFDTEKELIDKAIEASKFLMCDYCEINLDNQYALYKNVKGDSVKC